MDFQQLLYFNTVASFENMSKAAEMLHVSQPTLTKYISRLEEEVGQPLFDRKGKKLSLNSAGQEFLSYSIDAIKVIDTGVKKIATDRLNAKERIRICIIGDCTRILRCAAEYVKARPDTCLDIEEISENKDVPSINHYDVIVCPDSQKYSDIIGQSLFVNREYLAVEKGHPLSSRIAISSKDLNGLDMVYIKDDNSYESSLWGMQIMTIKPNRTHFVNSKWLQRALILSGVACGIVFSDNLSFYQECKDISLIPIMDKRFSMPMKICFKREKHLSEEAKNFIAFCSEYLGLL